MQVTLRQVQIDHGVFQVRVPHEKLNRPQICAGVKQVSCEAMPKHMRVNLLFQAASFRCSQTRLPRDFSRDRS